MLDEAHVVLSTRLIALTNLVRMSRSKRRIDHAGIAISR